MDSFRQQVYVPRDRVLNLKLVIPNSVPTGKAQIVVSIEHNHSRNRGILSFAGILRNSKSFMKSPIAIQKEMRNEWK